MKNLKYSLFVLLAMILLFAAKCGADAPITPASAPAPPSVADTTIPRAEMSCQNCVPVKKSSTDGAHAVFAQYDPHDPPLAPPVSVPTIPNLPAGAQDNTNTNLLTYLAIGILGLLGFVVKDDRESRRAHQTQLNDIALGVERIETKIDNSIKNTD